MPTPTRADVKEKVAEKLKAISDEDDLVDDEKSDLQRDLGMGVTLKKAMGVPYSKISKYYDNGIVVSMIDAGNCKTVKDSIDLVFKRAKGELK